MTDREQVIADLQYMKRDVLEDSDKDITLNKAIALLKEQEPLAVYEGKVNKCVCGNEINRYWYPEYCGFCGKKLEWY